MGFKIPERPSSSIDEGVWTEYEGSRFKIAYATNVRFLRLKQRLEHPHRRKIENGSIDPAEHRKLLTKAMAEAILLDWEGVDGDVPYSVKMAEQALMNDEAFREFVMTFSMDLANYKDEEREHEGNS